ncbi:acyltransferase family protein [Bifidobacterium leontopitheci]|uniref:Acyltransferase n=1 Tax=Bifidobacterium leontopitheci TaxID=2650774 RepID=A0A6I1GDF7_9BIFI|nr:acyltransferase family protein [Bifidobacterium leontopitheci]KAB7789555.1 Acyltransferase [Bifidobacterium leontopitheci]
MVARDFLWGSDNGHLWFLPTLFLMLMLSLALVKLCGTNVRLDIAMAVCAVGLLLTRRWLGWNTYVSQFAAYYVFFVIGFVYHRYEPQPANTMAAAAVVLAGCVAVSWSPRSFFAATLISAVAVLAVYTLAPRRSCAPMRLISKDSMGIYLFHSPMLYISFTYWPGISPALMILINFIGFGTVALVLTELMRHARCGIVIGE